MAWDLEFWNSDEWKIIQERLDKLDKDGLEYNPPRKQIFYALDKTPFKDVKVALIAQDPYPNKLFATGLAYAVPDWCTETPPTLTNIVREYMDDLHYPLPSRRNLEKWAKEGVLLWNSIPTCRVKQSLSHDWPEWRTLTQEIIINLSEEKKDIVFIFTGARARSFVPWVDQLHNTVIETSHPSPLGANKDGSPIYQAFLGSRVFTRTNAALCFHAKGAIDWKI